MPDLQLVRVDHQHVANADYSGQALDQFSAHGSTFTDCRFDKVKFKHAALGVGMEVSRYLGCSFDGAALTALGGYVRFEKCTFRNLKVTKSAPDYLEFVDCTFTGRITGLQLWGAPLNASDRYARDTASLARRGEQEPPGYRELVLRKRNDIRGNDFSSAQLVGVEFRFGVDLSAQELPTGDDYLYLPDAETALLHALASLSQDPSEAAGKAQTFLRSRLEHTVAPGQKQLLLRPKDYERSGALPPHVALAVEALRHV